MTMIKTEYQAILHQIDQTTRHPYLTGYLGAPPIPEKLVRVVYLFLYSQNLAKKRIRTITAAAAYLFMGLSLHESVASKSPKDPLSFQKQQLVILAGDYYSSLYYQVLGEKFEKATIEKLANVASNIQREKMRVYVGEKRVLSDEWMAEQLFLGIVDLFCNQKEQIEKWREFFTLFYQENRWDRDLLPWLPSELLDGLDQISM